MSSSSDCVAVAISPSVNSTCDQRRRVGVDPLGEVGERRAARQPDDLALAAGYLDAADGRGLQVVELLTPLLARLAAALLAATAPEGTGSLTATTGASTAAGTTGVAAADRRRRRRDDRRSRRHRHRRPPGRPPGAPGRPAGAPGRPPGRRPGAPGRAGPGRRTGRASCRGWGGPHLVAAAGRGMPASLLVKGLLPGRGPAGRGSAGVLAGEGVVARTRAGRTRAAPPLPPERRGCCLGGGTVGRPAPPVARRGGLDDRCRLQRRRPAGSRRARRAQPSWRLPSWWSSSPAPSPAGCAGKTSFSLRTTGGSTVDDADRTNSPMSWSLARTTLLSTPSSLASSYTRTLATALLSLGPGWWRGPLVRRHAHCCALIACSSPSRPAFGRPPSPGTRSRDCWSSGCREPVDGRGRRLSRKARGSARRRSARSRQFREGCRYAPRPGCRRSGRARRSTPWSEPS